MRYDLLGSRRSRKLGRIGIWKKRKIVVIIAMSIWVTDVAFFVNGKHPSYMEDLI
jgi:hypothetical protein